MKLFTLGQTLTRDDVYEQAESRDFEVEDTRITDTFYILEIGVRCDAGGGDPAVLYQLDSEDDETYTVTSDNWPDEHADKMPIYNLNCNCRMSGPAHRISIHGTSPDWDKAFFWVKDED